MTLEAALELVKTVGISGAILLIAFLWLVRVLAPRLLRDSERRHAELVAEIKEGRQSFTTALDRVVSAHQEAVDRVVEHCREESAHDRQERQRLLELIGPANGRSS